MYKQINKNLINLTLGIPKVEFILFPRLIMILKKFVLHFNWRPTIYDSLIASYEKRLNGAVITDKYEIKESSYDKGIKILSSFCDVRINENFIKYKKIYFSFPDKRDLYLVQFIIKSHIFARYFNKNCALCGDPNEKDHLYVQCNNDKLKQLKEKYLKELID